MACIWNITITLLVAIYNFRQEIVGGSVFLPNSPKQLTFKKGIMLIIAALTKAEAWGRVQQTIQSLELKILACSEVQYV